MKSTTYKICLVAAFVLVILVGMLMPGCGNATGQPYMQSGTYFDTVISVTVYDQSKSDAVEKCFEMADRYENLFSRTKEDSDISRINTQPGEWVEVDPETITLISEGLRYAQMSNGRFDITVGMLSDLWNISKNPGVIPDQGDIDRAVESIDYHNVEIDGQKVRIQGGMLIDLGAIAKGYIADRMKESLEADGVKSAMINLGGNVLTLGSKPDGSDFNVGLQKPFDKTNEVLGAVAVSDKSVVTSGTYERYFELDGKIYHHIMDTSTGYPVDNGLSAVTVISDRSVDGDGLSTTCFSMGLTEGIKLVESLDDTEAVFVTEDGELHFTSGIGKTVAFKVR